MNTTLKKLALLEKSFVEKEGQGKFQDYCSNTVNADLKKNVQELMNKIKTI